MAEELNIKINVDVETKKAEEKLKKANEKLGVSKDRSSKKRLGAGLSRSRNGIIGRSKSDGKIRGGARGAIRSAAKLAALVGLVMIAIEAVNKSLILVTKKFGKEIDDLGKMVGLNSEIEGKLTDLVKGQVEEIRKTIAQVPSAFSSVPAAAGVAMDFSQIGISLPLSQIKEIESLIREAAVRESVSGRKQTDENIKNFVDVLGDTMGFGD